MKIKSFFFFFFFYVIIKKKKKFFFNFKLFNKNEIGKIRRI